MSTVGALKSGSATSSEELDDIFREHSRLIYRAAYGVTASREDAEDVVQALFLRLWQRGLPPDFQRNPKAYLYRSAINLASNAERARRRHLSAVDASLRLAADDSQGPHRDPPTSPHHHQVAAAMAQLNSRAVEMLVLRYTEDCTDLEIAKLLGTSRSVVAVTLFRARARLRKLLSTVSGD